MKIYQIRQIASVLSELSKKKMPVKLGFAISVNIEELNRWIEKVEKQRIDLCRKYAKKDDRGEAVIHDDRFEIEDLEALTMEINKLMEEEIHLNVRSVPEGILESIDTSSRYDAVTADEISAMQFMLLKGGGD